MTRRDPSAGSAFLTLGVIAAVGLLLSLVAFEPTTETKVAGGTVGAASAGVDGDGLTAGDVTATGPGGTGGSVGVVGPAAGGGARTIETPGGAGSVGLPSRDGLACDGGRNGGATDVGVTGDTIKLAATVVDDGPGASFLAPVRIGMMAVVNKVNRSGGICGRRIQLILRNDSWDAQRGQQFLQNFVESEKVFGLAVVPSSEGLRAADSYIAAKGVPVVGTDGMLIHQYKNPWIWPVATSTISTMHAMAKNANERGSKSFGLVFDAKYHFGVEGAFAFNAAVKRLTGSDIQGYDASLKSCTERFCGLQPGKSSYASEARSFNTSCDAAPRCDFEAYLLEPDTANAFLHEPKSGAPVVGTGGAQPLFNRRFAEQCGTRCQNMWVWTGYNPPIEALAADPRIDTFVKDIRQESSSADVTNQFLQGGYVGMSLMVESLRKLGPEVTRTRLRATLDSMTFDTGLSRPLSWTAGNHFANVAARPFEVLFRQSFNGWRTAGDFVVDPWVGQDVPAGA